MRIDIRILTKSLDWHLLVVGTVEVTYLSKS